MSNETKQTAVDTLIVNFKESISYLESSLDCCNDQLTKVELKVRLSQARYFLTYAIEAKEIEKEQMRLDIEKKWEQYRIITNNEDAWSFKEWLIKQTYGGNK
jgi:hypothetical protein